MKRIDPDEKLYQMSITETEKLEDNMHIVKCFMEFEKEPMKWDNCDKGDLIEKRNKSKKARS